MNDIIPPFFAISPPSAGAIFCRRRFERQRWTKCWAGIVEISEGVVNLQLRQLKENGNIIKSFILFLLTVYNVIEVPENPILVGQLDRSTPVRQMIKNMRFNKMRSLSVWLPKNARGKESIEKFSEESGTGVLAVGPRSEGRILINTNTVNYLLLKSNVVTLVIFLSA
ncbi:hypothetical protein WN51_01458 [Melipona quadrifasciata]|uniref:Uncharacterized protein n=1 Tax=Melipona quadrifasciata TaxID=166423 RepID=A0A0M8ZYU4_9HYME|nr:hypothetical protein WN51_01458 [Melipona quadrifasciata]